MGFNQRLAKGYLVDGDGTPVKQAKLRFNITSGLGYTITHIVIDRNFFATTDNDGFFSITLWCDEDSLIPINWNVFFPVDDEGEGEDKHLGNFSLAYDDGSDIYVGALLSMGIPSPEPVELLYQSVDARISITSVRFDIVQELTLEQKSQARQNIGVGTDGGTSFTYIAYADDPNGGGFTDTFNAAKNFIAFKTTTVAIGSPAAADFAGLWKNYKGEQGIQGIQGVPGASGTGNGGLSMTEISQVDGIFTTDFPVGATILAVSRNGVYTSQFSTAGTTLSVPNALIGDTIIYEYTV